MALEDRYRTGAQPGNLNRQTFGHRGAETALRRGEPFRGLALSQEKVVTAELADDGIDPILIRNAIRLQTCVDLYYHAIVCAEQAGQIQSLSRYLKAHANLTARAVAVWLQVRALQVERGLESIDYESILAAKRNE